MYGVVLKCFRFRHLVHASDADQAAAILSRWGPEGQGKLGGERMPTPVSAECAFKRALDPRWADPIKNQIKKLTQAKAVNEVVGGFKPTESMLSQLDTRPPPLRVVNGISTTTSSTITTAARENVPLSTPPLTITGLPGTSSQAGMPGNSTIRWTAGLPAHRERTEEEGPGAAMPHSDLPVQAQPPPRKPITPSLATLEKAVAARIYFENIYFPLLRHPPSREQRRLAMEKDMMNMQINETQKENIRTRWRQNETDYLRERRRKVDVSAFVTLKTIGHGQSSLYSESMSRGRRTDHPSPPLIQVHLEWFPLSVSGPRGSYLQ